MQLQKSFPAPVMPSVSASGRDFMRLFLSLFIFSSALFGGAARAANTGLNPVHLRVAGREVVCKTLPVSDGEEIYVPLEALSALGAEGRLNSRGDAVVVKVKASDRQDEIAVARPDGKPMLALSDLARALNAIVEQPDKVGKDGKVITGTRGDNVYLLARVLDARFEDGALHVTTSFPVPFRSRNLLNAGPARGYIDCIGAEVPKDFRCSAVPGAEKQAVRMRAGQFSVEVARVVVELADGAAIKESDSASNSMPEILAGIERAPLRGVGKGSSVKVTAVDPPLLPASNDGGAPPLPDPEGPGDPPVISIPRVLPVPNSSRGSKASRRGGQFTRQAPPIEVRGVSFETDNDSQFRVIVATSGRANPFVHYMSSGSQLALDLPNASLQLTDAANGNIGVSHPLVSGLHVEQPQNAPAMTRITVDLARIIGFTVNARDNQLIVDLRLPRNATGALADKLIVVDAGHGGTSTGAVGHGDGTIYEKDITLGIALKLRAALEACGARVVMTRDRDVNVDLGARPALANSINADLFISVHNDSNGVANSASGTSTYYHMQDPSSRALATCVQQCVMGVTGLPSRGVLSDRVMYASGFAVLRESTMPAVLCEVAYINNARDRHKLLDSDFQNRVAHAMCDGLRAYVEGSSRTFQHPNHQNLVPDPLEEPKDPPASGGEN